MPQNLPSSFFRRETECVAQELLGKVLCRRVNDAILKCRIVETEAYLPVDDDACHASKKKTPKNEVMFEQAGTVYVYAIHGRYCVNFVTEEVDLGCAVLVRAAEPLCGLSVMSENRNNDKETELLSGPAKLCQALGIDKSLNGKKLSKGEGIWLLDDGFDLPSEQVKTTSRIGVTSAKERQLRYVVRNSDFASGPKFMR